MREMRFNLRRSLDLIPCFLFLSNMSSNDKVDDMHWWWQQHAYIENVFKPILYGYFRSGTSWRARTILAWKGIEYENRFVDLAKLKNVRRITLMVQWRIHIHISIDRMTRAIPRWTLVDASLPISLLMDAHWHNPWPFSNTLKRHIQVCDLLFFTTTRIHSIH